MPHILRPPEWSRRESEVTPHSVYLRRRAFIKRMGFGIAGLSLVGSTTACEQHAVSAIEDDVGPIPASPLATIPAGAPRQVYPAPRNTAFGVPERPLTDRTVAASYNNFYEFLEAPTEVWRRVGRYEPTPWEVEVTGLVETPRRYDLDDMARLFAHEERIYRHRCVEAWAMTVPWTGFPLRRLLEASTPTSAATHVRFISAARPKEMPGVERNTFYPWPYYEGLRLDEAYHELAFVATGIYGAPLPKQHGAPVRVVLPWKYGYKGPKAVVRIELVAAQPQTFWTDLVPSEYDFLSNVDPTTPHPRWSQAEERLLGEEGTVPTLPFNGYAEWVAGLY